MCDVDVMQDYSEIVHYERPGVPLYIRDGLLSTFPNCRALCHWHDDIELICVRSGSMRYQIGEEVILLHTGDSLFVNARQMHYGFLGEDPDCSYLCILFHPDLLSENRMLYQQYVEPVLENQAVPYLHLHADTAAGTALYEKVEQLYAVKQAALPGYELEAIGLLHILWRQLLPLSTQTTPQVRDYNDETLQKDMVSYIYQHYAEHLTLADIAAAGHVCQNKCCVIFRRYLQQPPIDFLNAYRLEVSCNLLRNTENSITEIALACGFNHLSYYSKLFQRKYGCTPSQFRTRGSV